MDPKQQSILDMFANAARGNAQILDVTSALILGSAQAQAQAPEAVQLPASTRDAQITTSEPAKLPAQADPKEDSDLMEAIMTELDKVEAKGLTPRDLGKRVVTLVPGRNTVPPHQRYKFRTAMQHLVSDKRIVRLDADDPKKLRYVTAIFVAEIP